jgi:hypothetical protein
MFISSRSSSVWRVVQRVIERVRLGDQVRGGDKKRLLDRLAFAEGHGKHPP